MYAAQAQHNNGCPKYATSAAKPYKKKLTHGTLQKQWIGRHEKFECMTIILKYARLSKKY